MPAATARAASRTRGELGEKMITGTDSKRATDLAPFSPIGYIHNAKPPDQLHRTRRPERRLAARVAKAGGGTKGAPGVGPGAPQHATHRRHDLTRDVLLVGPTEMPPPLSALLRHFSAADAAVEYSNRLGTAEPDREQPRRRYLLLAALLAACLLPRVLMAGRVTAVCPDGVVYFRMAGELERAQLDSQDAGRLQFGTYPVALATLHRLGLESEAAAKIYGVLLSSLAVLPLFGWARRQFDDRVAIVAALLYAGHPKLIEWSPEAIREPSFWFFFLSALYLLWRAAAEVDWRFFAAGGAMTTICALTRFEGWFLTLPMLGWTLLRFSSLRTARWRLTAGAAIGIAAIPVVLVAFGTLLPGDGGWRLLRFEPARRAVVWLTSWRDSGAIAQHEPTAPVAPDAQSPPSVASAAATAAAVSPAVAEHTALVSATPDADVPWSLSRALQMYLRTLERGLTPVFALFVLGGYLSRFQMFHRRDSWPILLVVLAVAAGIWIHLWYAHLASSRYVLTIVLLATRAAALGVIDFGQFASRLWARWRPAADLRGPLTATIVGLSLLVGSADAISSDFRSRTALADLGRWIQSQYGASAVVVGSEAQLLIIGYYADAVVYSFPPELTGIDLANWVEHVQADVVVLAARPKLPAEYQSIVDEQVRLKLEQMPTGQVPGDAKNVVVLARAAQSGAIAHQAALPATVSP